MHGDCCPVSQGSSEGQRYKRFGIHLQHSVLLLFRSAELMEQGMGLHARGAMLCCAVVPAAGTAATMPCQNLHVAILT